jgi:DNA-directed RNA polymerase sigma subunit (sigma70/sigma32)
VPQVRVVRTRIEQVADPAGDCFDQLLALWEEAEAEVEVPQDIRAASLTRHVSRLAPPRRQVIRWAYGIEGAERLTARQIAVRLGVSASTVAAYKEQALAELRRRYQGTETLQEILQAA